jgi:hypothetical protein
MAYLKIRGNLLRRLKNPEFFVSVYDWSSQTIYWNNSFEHINRIYTWFKNQF